MLDILYQRRSIRKYLPQPVEPEKVQQLVRAALLAPSARNVNPQRFIVVDDKALLAKLSQARDYGTAFLKDAPLAVVVTGDSSLTDIWIEDTVISAIILQLTAQSLGLGSCWAQIRDRKHNTEKTAEEYLQELLDLPQEIKVQCIIGIGYPGEQKPAKTDADLNFDRIFYNGYGQK